MKATIGFPVVLLLFWVVQSHQSSQNEARATTTQYNTAGQQFIDDTLRLITDGEREIQLDDDHRDLIIVIGMTGAGKTTMTKFITSMELLESHRTGPRYLIRDKNAKISQQSTVVSKTIFPDRIIDNSSNTVFYDMPGFSDTRNTSMELANAWFMKKVADHARRVKILLVVSHSTLQGGEHRDIILTFLDYVADFIPDPAKFKDAICMVITKVHGQRGKVIEPTAFTRGVADFLNDVRRNLESVKRLSRLKGKRDLIDALLSKDSNGTYNRIAYFLQPKAPGPLINIKGMAEQQEFIKSVIEDSAVYVETSPGDFGISVSAEAQSLSFNLTQIIANKLCLAITAIQEKIWLHFQLKLVDSSFSSLGKITQDVKKLEEIPGRLANQASLQDFLLTFISLLSDLQVEALEGDFPEIESQLEKLQFFENVTGMGAPINFHEWIKLLTVGVQKVRGDFQQKLSSFNDFMVEQAENATRTLRRSIEDKLNQPGDKDMLAISEEVYSLWAGTRTFVAETIENSNNLTEFASRLDAFLASNGLQFDTRVDKVLDVDAAGREFNVTLKHNQWLAPFKALQKFLRIESLKLRLQNHKEKNLRDYRNSIALLERNLATQSDALTLDAIRLKIKMEPEVQAWEARLSQQRITCEREKISAIAAHSQNLKHLRGLEVQEKSDIMEEISREQKKRAELRVLCKETHDVIRESMKQESLEQVARLKSVADSGNAAEEHERYIFNTALSRVTEACERSLQGEERDCRVKMEGQKSLFDIQDKRLAQQLAEEGNNYCRRGMEEENARCSQQSTEITRRNNAEAMKLQLELEALEHNCTAGVQAKMFNCDSKVSSLANTTHHQVQGLQNDLEKARAKCENDVNLATTSGTDNYFNRQKVIDEQIVVATKSCQASIRENNDKYVNKLEPYRKMAGA